MIVLAAAATRAAAAPVTFPCGGLGPIPDGADVGPAAYGPPLVVTCEVSGLAAPVRAVRVEVAFGPAHPLVGDLDVVLVAFGFVVSFVAAWIVVKTFLDYVQRHGFGLFAWWRVIVGTLGLIALALGYGRAV